MHRLLTRPPNDASLPTSVPHDDTLDPHSDEASDSEYDDSSDSNWSGGSAVESIAHDDDYETQESCEEVEIVEEDLSVYLVDESIAAKARRLVQEDPCESKCLEGLESDVEHLLMSLTRMEKSERVTGILTALAVLMKSDYKTGRSHGVRGKLPYVLPLVGRVCAQAFCSCYGVSLMTVQRYKKQIRGGDVSMKTHGNSKNKNASVNDLSWLTSWFKEFASEVGDVVPMREFVELSRIRRREPAKSTMRMLLSLSRLKRRADMAAEAKRVQDERNSAPSFVDQLQGVMEEIEESERTQSQAKETCASKPKKKARKASSA
ncbi:unnamed protein product [Phytophthora fragariaefolia]|uniref:Unnamed protein product n=1 Tax=Phytophthora fragariaefolia TaxID=1490495 RepID=A0A9W6YI45_9STRA|nr:unnamed protein product [Phytophthora fragariaefolia]